MADYADLLQAEDHKKAAQKPKLSQSSTPDLNLEKTVSDKKTIQSTDQTTNQSTSQSIDQSINQSRRICRGGYILELYVTRLQVHMFEHLHICQSPLEIKRAVGLASVKAKP